MRSDVTKTNVASKQQQQQHQRRRRELAEAARLLRIERTRRRTVGRMQSHYTTSKRAHAGGDICRQRPVDGRPPFSE